MRSSLYYHIKLISVLLTVFLIFANFSVSRATTLENANISEYAKPYIEKLTESIQFDYDDYLESMNQMRNMGGFSSLMNMLPGLGNMGMGMGNHND